MKNLNAEEVQHLALRFLIRLDKSKDYKGVASLAQPDGLQKMVSALRAVPNLKIWPLRRESRILPRESIHLQEAHWST